MLSPSPSCAHGSARVVGRHLASRSIVGAACVVLAMLGLPAGAKASPIAPIQAPEAAAAVPCADAAADIADAADSLGAYVYVYHPHHRAPAASTHLVLAARANGDDDAREKLRFHSPRSHLETAHRVRRPSHAWKGSPTTDVVLVFLPFPLSVREVTS